MPQDVHIVVNKHTPFVVQAFEKIGKVTALDSGEINKNAVKDADILIVRSETVVDHTLLEGSRVKFVGTVTIGTDHIDKEYLSRMGITFVSAPGSNANSVGEYIVSALLELAYKKKFSLHDKTIGIVGVGNVGSNVWHKAAAMGMKVLLNDPPLQQQGSNYQLHSLDKLMDADIITLHVPLAWTGDNATHHLFDGNRIRKMKQGAILINTSRGGVVETDALKNALLKDHLSAAVLDVWEKEPNIDTSLLDLVTFGTPHIAGYSLDGKVNALKINYEAVCHFLSLPVDRDIKKLIPDPDFPELEVNPGKSTEDELLRYIVKQCYDICADDRSLRRIGTFPEEDRSGYFSKLRASYPIKREFNNRTVIISKESNKQEVWGKNIADILGHLGFVVKK